MERKEAARLARLDAKLLFSFLFFSVRSCLLQMLTGVTFMKIPSTGHTICLRRCLRRQLSAKPASCNRRRKDDGREQHTLVDGDGMQRAGPRGEVRHSSERLPDTPRVEASSKRPNGLTAGDVARAGRGHDGLA